jgi:hypothetical protein
MRSFPTARVHRGLLFSSPHYHTFSPGGVAGLSFTARIGRAQLHRARSASKKDGLAAPPSLLRPRVARAQGTHLGHPPCWRTFSVSGKEQGCLDLMRMTIL